MKAVREIICSTSHIFWYARRLCVREVAPRNSRPPISLTRRAKAQSSINSPRIEAIPPIWSSVCLRTNIHPPAAAAVRRRRLVTQAGGYNMKKKNRNAGMKARSAADSQRSLTISDTRSKLPDCALATSSPILSGSCTISASVIRRYSVVTALACRKPTAKAHNFPVHPGGGEFARTTCSRSSAWTAPAALLAAAAVSSELLSSITITRIEPAYLWVSSEVTDLPMQDPSSRAGIKTTRSGAL